MSISVLFVIYATILSKCVNRSQSRCLRNNREKLIDKLQLTSLARTLITSFTIFELQHFNKKHYLARRPAFGIRDADTCPTTIV